MVERQMTAVRTVIHDEREVCLCNDVVKTVACTGCVCTSRPASSHMHPALIPGLQLARRKQGPAIPCCPDRKLALCVWCAGSVGCWRARQGQSVSQSPAGKQSGQAQAGHPSTAISGQVRPQNWHHCLVAASSGVCQVHARALPLSLVITMHQTVHASVVTWPVIASPDHKRSSCMRSCRTRSILLAWKPL